MLIMTKRHFLPQILHLLHLKCIEIYYFLRENYEKPFIFQRFESLKTAFYYADLPDVSAGISESAFAIASALIFLLSLSTWLYTLLVVLMALWLRAISVSASSVFHLQGSDWHSGCAGLGSGFFEDHSPRALSGSGLIHSWDVLALLQRSRRCNPHISSNTLCKRHSSF